MSPAHQEELLAIAQALLHMPAAGKPSARSGALLVPRVIGQAEEPEAQAEDGESQSSAQGGI